MTSELKAAAEEIIAISDIPNIVDNEQRWYRIVTPARKLADAYLARLAADEQREREDAEPITEELLRSLGFSAVGRGILCMHVGHTGMSWSQLGMFYGTTVIDIKTRCQLRKLLEALKGST